VLKFAVKPPVQVVVPVQFSEEKFPVHRIYCVGRNYADHVKEMGGDPKAEPPIFFSKPADAVVTSGADVRYPQATADLHHEVELVVALQSGGKHIPAEQAFSCVYAYGVGIDFTRRDLQAAAKNAGKPWDVAKGFDQSAPISALNPVASCGHPLDARISLRVNDEIRQDASLDSMIWSVAEIISELSNFFELQAGDLIFTGTPSGVAATNPGDHLAASIEGVADLEFNVV